MTSIGDQAVALQVPNSNNIKATTRRSKAEKPIAPTLIQSDSDESNSDGASSTEGETRDHEIRPMAIVFSGSSDTVEPVTGIIYPETLNGYAFIGCGVRTKYLIVHAYAVGVYLDMDTAVAAGAKATPKTGATTTTTTTTTKQDWINRVFLDPNVPRIFRLVLNRNFTSAQYIGATLDALTPLMRGQHLDKLEEMKKQEMPRMLLNKTEIYLKVQGDTLTLQVGTERAGKIESSVLTRAVCENYLGSAPVSPAMKKAVINKRSKAMLNGAARKLNLE